MQELTDKSFVETAADCTVKVNKELIRYSVASMNLDQFIDAHHDLTLTLGRAVKDKTQIENPEDYAAFLGKPISVSITPTGDKVSASKVLEFIGVITEMNFENSVDALNVITLKAQSPTISMDGSAENRIFADTTPGDIVSGLVRDHQITPGKLDSFGSNVRFCVQHRETDYEFIRRLAGDAGRYAFYDGKNFNVTKADGREPEELNWRTSLGSFSMDMGTTQTEFTASGFNYEQSREFTQNTKNIPPDKSFSSLIRKAPDASKDIFKGASFVDLHSMTPDAQSLDESLKRMKERSLGRMITCSGQSIIPSIKVGKPVQIRGMSGFDGTYYVKSIKHIYEGSGKYRNNFTCVPLDLAYVDDVPDKNRSSFLQTGIVMDNNDPDKLGRVKVKFPWNEKDTVWVRVLTAHAGDQHGWYSIPEVDDEVLVGYEMGDPDDPIILGALYNSDTPPHDDTQVQDNNVKLFLTKSGNRILIRDESGKESIEIVNKDGSNKIILEAGGPTITIESSGDITLKGANLTLQGSGDIKLEADGKITLKSGADLELKAGANLKAEASANADIKGSGQVNVQGSMINLN